MEKLEEKGKFEIKVEPEDDLYTNDEQALTDEFINNVGRDLSSLISPSNEQSHLPCDKCSILAETNAKHEQRIKQLIETVILVQQQNAEYKLKLKLSDIHVDKQTGEIDKLRKELELAKMPIVSPPLPSPSQTGRERVTKRKRSGSGTPSSSPQQVTSTSSPLTHLQQMCTPPNPPRAPLPPLPYPNGQSHLPPIGYGGYNVQHRHVLHGIDGSKKNYGYYCICGAQFPIEPLLYDHLKKVISSNRPMMMSQSHPPTPSQNSSYLWNVVVCCICPLRFVDWNVFRAHTTTAHGISDLERFEWNEKNMNRNVCCSGSSQNQTCSSVRS